jgi:hypothetical protein
MRCRVPPRDRDSFQPCQCDSSIRTSGDNSEIHRRLNRPTINLYSVGWCLVNQQLLSELTGELSDTNRITNPAKTQPMLTHNASIPEIGRTWRKDGCQLPGSRCIRLWMRLIPFTLTLTPGTASSIFFSPSTDVAGEIGLLPSEAEVVSVRSSVRRLGPRSGPNNTRSINPAAIVSNHFEQWL